ncbi:hypothetical protein M2436_002289 [Streptomyces sp. HB372]|nr:hypothetical protein [Streptomyces sp. HB372]
MIAAVRGVIAASTAAGVEAETARLDVGEHHVGADEADRVRGGGEGEGGDDHLVARADAQGQQQQVKGRGPRVDGDAVPVVDQAGEALFEGRDFRSLHDATAAQHAYRGLDLVFPDDWAGSRNRLLVDARHERPP